MAIAPGTYNFTVQKRADHNMQLQFKDSSNAAINLTGSTVTSQVWDTARSTKYADFAVTYTNRTGGIIDLALTDVQTATFPLSDLRYDVMVTDSNGMKDYYLEGTVYVDEGYTA
jgi:hypothetical protein